VCATSVDGAVCLQAGAVRQQDSNAQLQLNMETEVQKLSERMAASMRELQLAIKSSLEQLGRSIHELTAAFPEEREQRKADIEHVGSSLCARLDDTVAALDEERFARLEQERESLRRCDALSTPDHSNVRPQSWTIVDCRVGASRHECAPDPSAMT
jgi:hypothetical protein